MTRATGSRKAEHRCLFKVWCKPVATIEPAPGSNARRCRMVRQQHGDTASKRCRQLHGRTLSAALGRVGPLQRHFCSYHAVHSAVARAENMLPSSVAPLAQQVYLCCSRRQRQPARLALAVLKRKPASLCRKACSHSCVLQAGLEVDAASASCQALQPAATGKSLLTSEGGLAGPATSTVLAVLPVDASQASWLSSLWPGPCSDVAA